MNKILIPSDFSEFSDYAVRTALDWPYIHKTSIELFHCIEQSYKKDDESKVIKDVENKLLAQIEETSNSMITEVRTIVAIGDLLDQLQQFTDNNGYELIIIGSHGASGKKEFFLGSNAQKIIRTVHCPVLTVKKPFQFGDIKKVLFASGFSPNDKDAFIKFVEFVKHKSPELHLLAINTSSFFTQPSLVVHECMNDFAALAHGLSVKKYFYSDISVEAGIRHFSEDLKIDLIAISNHERHPIKRMFQGSNVEMLVNHSQIPVLTIDYL